MVAASELPINTNATTMQMAQAIFGDGVTVVSAAYTGDSRSSGIYTDGFGTSPGVVPSDTGVILSTGQARGFSKTSGQSNQSRSTSTNTSGVNNNSLFNSAAGARTYDAAWIDVSFIPTGDMMTMPFVVSSEDFPEYANSLYQDFVGVWVTGVQVEMAIGSANPGNLVGGINQNLYNDNTGDQFNTEMDGFTITMTLTFPVNAGVVNSIRIGIAEAPATESFLPGPQLMRSFEAAMVEEIREVIPGFDPETVAGHGQAARRMLKRFEAELLMRSRMMARAA